MGDIDAIGQRRQILQMGPRPVPSLCECWRDEDGIDVSLWNKTEVGTGTVVRSVAEPPYLKVIAAGAVNNDSARLYGVHRWFCNPDTALAGYLKNSIFQTLHMEFEAKILERAVVLNTEFFMGLGFSTGVTKASNNIIGFVLDVSDNLIFRTADAAAATDSGTLVAAADVDDWHKFEIVVMPGQVRAYLNGALVSTLTANLAETAMYPNFFLPQENAAGTPSLHIGVVRIWPEDILR